MQKIAIANACFVFGAHWSLPKTAEVAKRLGADGMGVYPLRGAVARRVEFLKVPALFVGERFSGPLGWIMSPSPTACRGFVRYIAETFGVPIETHSPESASRFVQKDLEAWMETIPEFGLSLEDHIRAAMDGGFGLSVDNWDLQGRHHLFEPFGNPVKALKRFLGSGLVRNFHAQPTGLEVRVILEGRGRATILVGMLKVLKDWGDENLIITLEVNPFTVWQYDPLAILPGRYLRRLGQILGWVKEQVT